MEVDFDYYSSSANVWEDGLFEEACRRIELVRARNPELRLPAGAIIELMDHGGWVMGAVWADDELVGIVFYTLYVEVLTQRNVLCVELAHLDNRKGLFEAVEEETDRIAKMDAASIRVNVMRKGWQKRMKMAKETGYNIVGISVEKSNGWREN